MGPWSSKRASAARIRQPPENSTSGRVSSAVPEAEPAQDDARLRLEAVPAQRLEAVLEVPVPRGERVVRRFVEPHRQRFQLALELPDLRESRQGLAQDRAAGLAGGLLRQVADGRLAGPADAPGVGRIQAREDPAERGLADAVRPDEPDALAPAELPRDVPEEHPVAVGLGDDLDLDHPHILRGGASPPGVLSRERGRRGQTLPSERTSRSARSAQRGTRSSTRRRCASPQWPAARCRSPAALAAAPRSSQTRAVS